MIFSNSNFKDLGENVYIDNNNHNARHSPTIRIPIRIPKLDRNVL
jgi:hypothetical protein